MVFVKKDVKPRPGFNVMTALNKKKTVGDLGLEIEVEGKRLPREDATPPPWSFHVDHSLRGEENGEYVLSKPIAFDALPDALAGLWGVFEARKSVLDESNRTSVHVHLNVQNFHFNRLTSFMALYFAFEEVLTEWCGEHRVGNLFCMRAKDAPAIITQIRDFIRTDGRKELREHHHYAALNANALHKFGSLEIRTLRGVSSPSVIVEWVAILRRLYDLSLQFTDPRDIPALFSAEGPMAFFDTILGPGAGTIRAGIKMTEEDIRDSMYYGIRLAQDLCYSRDWDLFQSIELKADPFGRDPKKIMKKFMNAIDAAPSSDNEVQMGHEGEYAPEYDEEEQYQPSQPTTASQQTYPHLEPFTLPTAPPQPQGASPQVATWAELPIVPPPSPNF
jgi:hypothetical protein